MNDVLNLGRAGSIAGAERVAGGTARQITAFESFDTEGRAGDCPRPKDAELWPRLPTPVDGKGSAAPYDAPWERVRAYARSKPWVCPNRTHYFFCDIHADADAFRRSLVASGGISETGPNDRDIALTRRGRTARFVIGGDCLDNGPSNLRLLSMLKRLLTIGADVELLAGNRDLRTLLGIVYAGCKDPRSAHLFVRMGKKSVTFFHEIWDAYLARTGLPTLISESEARRVLFPDESWYDDFPPSVAGTMTPLRIQRELEQIREKTHEFEVRCREIGLRLGMVHAAAVKARDLFMSPRGQYRWFFSKMNLAYRAGSFLFVHAGVDDTIAGILRRDGIAALNTEFRRAMKDDLFGLYHGPLGNIVRTRYRLVDRPLTDAGAADLHGAGLYAVIHGHRNIVRGQRLAMRSGLLNFECDATVDRNTRALVGLPPNGAAATVLRSDGRILGISADHPTVKIFDATAFGATTVVV